LEEEEEDEEDDENVMVGFVCSTRCAPMENDTKSTSHKHNGPLLTIHSIVVKEEYRRQGLGRAMLQDYIETLRSANTTAENPISKVILFAKQHLLTFFIQCGFSVIRPSVKVNGKEQRYYLELSLQSTLFGTNSLLPRSGNECYIVDSFASTPGTGNPAAVVLLPPETNSDKLAGWMQMVAAEFNLSETAFCWARNQTELESKELHWNIRYFSPKVEVPLCGHATLASAAVLYQTIPQNQSFRIVFHAREDVLTMELAREDVLTMELAESESSNDLTPLPLTTKISMQFPAKPPRELETREEKSAVRKMLECAFSCDLEPLYVGISDIGDLLIELTPTDFQEIGYEQLNLKALLEWDGYYRGVIVCCQCPENGESKVDDSSSPDCLSRFFGPKAGINEDPVTGSAHCVLAPYFSLKLNKEKIIGKQMSERGGIVQCWVTQETVRLTGTAVTTMSGTLWL
jgi:predicted PhzF superfamily epimerase YddE/YHI9/GNAT superfamily N-acetyltransferase